MKFLLDTNILSDLIRDKPNQNLVQWIKSTPSDALHISVLTIGEIRRGVEKLEADSNRRNKLVSWLEVDLISWFGNRILPIDPEVVDRWGYLTARVKNAPAIDSLIAATALCYNLKIVTRNVKDFQFPALEVINPFD